MLYFYNILYIDINRIINNINSVTTNPFIRRLSSSYVVIIIINIRTTIEVLNNSRRYFIKGKVSDFRFHQQSSFFSP